MTAWTQNGRISKEQESEDSEWADAADLIFEDEDPCRDIPVEVDELYVPADESVEPESDSDDEDEDEMPYQVPYTDSFSIRGG